jgi:hypothetical protein
VVPNSSGWIMPTLKSGVHFHHYGRPHASFATIAQVSITATNDIVTILLNQEGDALPAGVKFAKIQLKFPGDGGVPVGSSKSALNRLSSAQTADRLVLVGKQAQFPPGLLEPLTNDKVCAGRIRVLPSRSTKKARGNLMNALVWWS